MSPTHRHLIKYPHARTTTLAYIETRERKTEQLRAEIEASKRVNEYRDSIGYVSWPRRVLSSLIRGWGAV